jgi:hypothetical protein
MEPDVPSPPTVSPARPRLDTLRRALALFLARSPVSVGIYLRLLAAVYLVAFASLWGQVEGLAGSRGILPVESRLRAAREHLEADAYRLLPTLSWLDPSDAFLQVLSGGGGLVALASIVFPFSFLPWLVLWAAYLSLQVACGEFLGFQWDILLLEAGFLAIFVAPMTILPRARLRTRPSRIAVWLSIWLLFRLLFASGVVKLTWEDPTWLGFTALEYHYETQPLPPWTAWYAYHLPAWIHRASVRAMYVLEIGVPFLFFLPGRIRLAACALSILLQLGIIATGNYCFFNYLTIALCMLLVDDRFWPAPVKRLLGPIPELSPDGPRRRFRGEWPAWITGPLAALIVLLSLHQMPERTFNKRTETEPSGSPGILERLDRAVAPFHIVSSYGLFQVMTTHRPEITIEGSDDGKEWKAYEFRWKPGDPARRPTFVAPHQPRLDWQMWFAALGHVRGTFWFQAFALRLLEGSEPVLALLQTNPFPGKPPRLLRATLHEYRFTTSEERRKTGAWWERHPRGLYLPPISLRGVEAR